MRFALAAVLLMVAGAAWAADAPAPPNPAESRYTPALQKCLDSPDGQSTAGMIDCTMKETDVQDARLNAAYRKDMADLNARQKAKLQAAQRAWIAFRDAECASFQDEDWGSLSRVLAADCILDLTIKRTIDLENYPPGT